MEAVGCPAVTAHLAQPAPAEQPLTDYLQGWGTVAGALFAAAAFAVALALFLRERRRHRKDDERYARDDADRQMTQARTVVVDVGKPHTSGAFVQSFPFGVTNYSASPILDVEVWVDVAGDRADPANSGYIPWHPVVAPGERKALGVHVRRDAMRAEEVGEQPWLFVEVSVTFTDAAGVRWHRKGREQPTQVFPPGVLD